MQSNLFHSDYGTKVYLWIILVLCIGPVILGAEGAERCGNASKCECPAGWGGARCDTCSGKLRWVPGLASCFMSYVNIFISQFMSEATCIGVKVMLYFFSQLIEFIQCIFFQTFFRRINSKESIHAYVSLFLFVTL